MSREHGVENIFFDLGGTLVDLSGLAPSMAVEITKQFPALGSQAARISKAWVQETGAAVPGTRSGEFRSERQLARLAIRGALLRAGINLSTTAGDRLVGAAWRGFVERARLQRDASRDLLLHLRSIVRTLGLVTDGDLAAVRPLLSRLEIGDLFDVTIVSESIRAYKPDPRVYLSALREAHAGADASVFVSDSPVDLVGAARVGMGTIWIRRDRASPLSAPPGSLVISSLSELPRTLAKRTGASSS